MQRRHTFLLASLIVIFCIPTLYSQIPYETSLDPSPQGIPPTSGTNLSTQRPRTEDWTTISLAKSGLPLSAIGGVLLSKVEQPACTRELLRMLWRTGDPIDVYVIRPHTTEKPPVALYLLNYTFDVDIFREEGWCNQVGRDGVAVVGFVSALAGQRFHTPRPMKEWFVSELQEALSSTTHDVQMMLNYLDTRGDLDMHRIGILGQGSGGGIAILAAAADSRIVAMDLINPWGDWPDWLKDSRQIPENERPTYLKPEFLQGVSTLDPITYLPQWKEKALRIQQVMDDPVTPPKARDKIASSAPKPAQVVRYVDKVAEAQGWGTGGISGWLTQQLNPAHP